MIQITPLQSIPLVARGFDPKALEVSYDNGLYLARVRKVTPSGYETIEYLGRSPEIAIHQLSRLAALPARSN